MRTSISGGFAVMTMAMKQLQVRFHIFPALCAWLDVIDLEPIVCPEVQPTPSAFPLLGFYERRDSFRSHPAVTHSGAPIDPIAVERTPSPRHLHVNPASGIVVSGQAARLTSRLKPPTLSVIESPVFVGNPAPVLVLVTTNGPPP
jgi:hypothetical protein